MWKCIYCEREFSRKGACTLHERYYCKLNANKQPINTYTEHKKIRCGICGRLIDVANIDKHLKGHDKKPRAKKENFFSHEGLICSFCSKECKNKNSLIQHEIRCAENPKRICCNQLSDYIQEHRKGKNKSNCSEIAKAADSLKKRYQEGTLTPYTKGKIGTFTGKHYTEDSKRKTRLTTLNNLKNKQGQINPCYNSRGCRYIEELNKKKHWNLQHAENGGEFCVDGYYLDGYDVNLNIAFEYDESRHYKDVYKNVLKSKDVERMHYIINKLHCRFFRYNEKLDYFYEIT